MRIIDITTQEEVCVADTLNVSRFESLSATDYHLGVLPLTRSTTKIAAPRGALEAIGGGIWDATMYPTRAIGGGIWDATMYSTRLFISAPSVRSAGSQSETASSSKAPSGIESTNGLPNSQSRQVSHLATLTQGMKIFIQSPYDCVLATKPSIADHLAWLDGHAFFEEAWNLLDRYPEAVRGIPDSGDGSSPSTPTKVQGSLVDFFADDSSQSATLSNKNFNSQAEKEKRRIGEEWVQQLVSAKDWSKAGRICGQVLSTSSSWEHWVWVFADAEKFEEVTPFIPTIQLQPPLPSVVYEIVLGHYASVDRLRLSQLLDRWPPDLYDIGSIIAIIQAKLKNGDVREDSIEGGEKGRDWRILTEGLAKLYLADGRPREALRCYIRLKDADTAMSLLTEYHLVSAISDDISGLILLRVSKEQQKSAPLSELEEATSEAIRLLVDEAHQGIVRPETVISQLERRKDMRPYLFFYFRALWNGDTSTSPINDANSTTHLAATEGKSLVSDFADTAVSLFATYDRSLLLIFLKSSQSYNLATASQICERANYIPELVYLLSKEGRLARALSLIIEQLGDVSQAIAFAKSQNDPELWDDLLEYSMNKPHFIRGLLEEVGTAIDPIKLVRRIPATLEIQGLKQGLSRMIKEYEIQASISEGVARVLRGEVAIAMATRSAGQNRGVRVDVPKQAQRPASSDANQHHPSSPQAVHPPLKTPKIKPGHCPICGLPFSEAGKPSPIPDFPSHPKKKPPI